MSEIDPGVVAVEAADQISAPDGTKEIGRRRLRKEDAKLVTGQTQWTDNIQFAGMLHPPSSAARWRTRRSSASTCHRRCNSPV